MKLSKILTAFAGALLISTAVVMAAPTSELKVPPSNYNVIEGTDAIIAQSYSIEIFKKVLDRANLQDMIKYDADEAGFTIFIPTDKAMSEDLSKDRLNELMTNQEAARYFVMFHMLDGKKTWADLLMMNEKEVNSMSQTTLLFTVINKEMINKDMSKHTMMKRDRILVNGAMIMSSAYQGSHNVLIYVIDAVVTP